MKKSYDPDAKFIIVDGEKYCYRVSGHGPTVLLIHGITDSSQYFWREFFEYFNSEYTVIALDLRGHGCSAKPKKGYSTIDQVDLVIKFMDIMDIDRTILLGHSLGGIVVTKLALIYPEKVERLVIYDSPLGGGTIQDISWLFSLPRRGGLLSSLTLIPFFGKYLYNIRTPETLRQIIELLRLFYNPELITDELLDEKMKCPYHAYFYSFWRVIIFENIEKDLYKLSMPVLVICGDNDPYVSQKKAKSDANKIPNSKLVIIDEAGHFPLIEQPLKFNEAVDNFFQTFTTNKGFSS